MRANETGRGAIARACKTALVAVVALLVGLIALGNVTNYGANAAFVQHVLAMDTIFPGSLLRWRAIDNPSLQTVAYLGIIASEALCALVTIVAVVRLATGLRDAERFRDAVPLAVLGLTMILIVFGGGFLAIGGEWFLMWQSTQWNGTDAATRYFTVTALTLLVLVAPDGRRDAEP
jgi:predicted small integral membrane protein